MTDHLGSTITQYNPSRSTDTRGVFEGDALYEPDGVTTNPAPGAFKFAAGIQVPSGVEPTGVYHFGRRFYDTNTAQWTQPDPLEQNTDLTQANRYTYAGANGVNHTDPTGLKVGRCNPYVEDDPDCGGTSGSFKQRLIGAGRVISGTLCAAGGAAISAGTVGLGAAAGGAAGFLCYEITRRGYDSYED